MTYDIKRSGKFICQLRTQNGYTQEKLAEELNIDRSLLSHIETGKRACSLDLFIQLSNLFQVSLDLLILGRNRHSHAGDNHRNTLKAGISDLICQLEAFQREL